MSFSRSASRSGTIRSEETGSVRPTATPVAAGRTHNRSTAVIARTLGRAGRLVPLIVPGLLLLAWQEIAWSHRLPHSLLPAPIEVATAARDLSQTGELWRDLAVSGARAGAGLLLGGGLGFVLALVTGANRFTERLLDPTVQMLRTIPNLALIPLVILWLGIGEPAKVFLIAAGVFFPLYLNTYQGIRSVDAGLVEMARTYGLRGWELFRHVLLPGATPSILTGLRFALGSMWLTLIAAETLAADSGIGYMTTTAREFMQTDRVLVGVLLYAALGVFADQTTRRLERSLLQWHPRYVQQRPRLSR